MDSDKLVERRNVPALDRPPDMARFSPEGPSLPTVMEDDQGIMQYWFILVKHRWVILSCVLVATTIATISSLKAVKIYDAVGRIEISREHSDDLGIKRDSDNDDWDYTVMLDTQARILESDPIALDVIRKLGLAKGSQPASALPVKSSAIAENPAEAAALGAFKGGLHVRSIPRTRLLEIHYLSPNPKLAAQIVNTLSEVYVEHNFKAKYEATQRTTEWISNQLNDLLVKVESSQEKLVKYEREHGILGIDEKQNIITKKLDDLNRELTEAESDRMQKESLYKIATSSTPELMPGRQGGALDEMRRKEADLASQLAQANTEFGPSYPKVRDLNEQLRMVRISIAKEIENIGTRARNEYLAAMHREKMVRASLELQKQQANQLNESAIDYNLLKRDADSNRQLYESLRQKLKEASVTAGLQTTNLRIVDPARVPGAPSKPNIPRNIALAFWFSLAFGVGLSFLLEMMDNTLRTPDQVQGACSLPALAMIPHGDLSKPRRLGLLTSANALAQQATANSNQMVQLVSQSNSRSVVAESFRALRTSLLLSSVGAPPKVIVVTSALPQEGKSTTAMNSAIVLAQNGARVLLVDADMRRPSVHQAFRLSSQTGLSTYLAGMHELAEVTHSARDVVNLSVVPAGPPPSQPAEMLSSPRMLAAMAQWRQQFDHVVIDTPPALSVTDAVLLSVDADAVVVVVRSGQTTKQALRHVQELLTRVNAKVAGVVVNAVNFRGADYYYYYGHSGKYKRYYGYHSYGYGPGSNE